MGVGLLCGDMHRDLVRDSSPQNVPSLRTAPNVVGCFFTARQCAGGRHCLLVHCRISIAHCPSAVPCPLRFWQCCEGTPLPTAPLHLYRLDHVSCLSKTTRRTESYHCMKLTQRSTPPPPPATLVTATVRVVSTTFGTMSYVALYKYFPLLEQWQVLFP